MSSDREEEHSLLQDDSEEEFDWEEVEVPAHQHLEITLNAKPKAEDASTNKKKGISHAERLIRIDCHKIHTVALIANARVRNKWINDPLLHARLLSLTPLHLQTAFGAIHKTRVPDQNQRGRMFERAVEALVNWWSGTFFDVIPDGHIRNYTFDDIQRRLEVRGLHVPNANDPDATLDVDTLREIIEDEVETIRSEKSLMKHALMASGSRDTSAQLFTALCRALGIPTRLVVSIQSVPWQASVGKPKPKYEKKPIGKGKEVAHESNPVAGPSHWDGMSNGQRVDGEAPEPKSETAKGKQKAKPVVKLRKQKAKGNVLGAPRKLASPDPLTTPPVYWTEVFSRPDSKWFPVDPIRGLVNKRKSFDPTPSTTSTNATPQSNLFPPGSGPSMTSNRRAPATKIENRMVYVLAFEEDGYARDVTRRYAKEYAAKVAKVQGGSSAPNVGGGGQGRQAWWASVLRCIERPYQLNRDDLEDQELEILQMKEGMPTTVGGFKDHPLYVLERHLRQTETIHPPPPATPELGRFRGEPVYPRGAVVALKTAENWMRSMGRTVRAGAQPMKMVRARAGTVGRMRELEALRDELRVAGAGAEADGASGEAGAGPEVMQGLYAYSQTEPYVADPVVDGKVPKNRFGNIDLYVPSMLPEGAAHIPYKGVAKIARRLGVDYADAVTGFEFKKRRALPVIEGIVVAAAHERAVLEAFRAAQDEAAARARAKREERALKLWTRLVHGLRIRARLQAQYAPGTHHPRAGAGAGARDGNEKDEGEGEEREDPRDEAHERAEQAGGFLAGADRVVHAFRLPRNTHPVLPPPRHAHAPAHTDGEDDSGVDADEADAPREAPALHTFDLDLDSDPDLDLELGVGGEAMAMAPADAPALDGAAERVPRTMAEMAAEAEAAAAAAAAEGGEGVVEEIAMSAPAPALVGAPPPTTTTTTTTTMTTRSRRARGPPASANASGNTSASGGAAKRRAPAAGQGRRKRARRARGGSDSDSEQEEEDGGGEDEEEEDGADGGGVDGEWAGDGAGTSPRKTGGRTRKAAKAAASVPPSTRTLRSASGRK